MLTNQNTFLKILEVGSDWESWDNPNKGKFTINRLTDNQFLIPGFVDMHTHATQLINLGLGLNEPLLDWLDHTILPKEKLFENEDFAKTVFADFVVSIFSKF